MNIGLNPKRHKLGATLVEMVAAVILIGIALIGVAQYVLVSKLNVHMSNIRAAVLQELSDQVVSYQDIPETDIGGTNVPVSAQLSQYIYPYPNGIINILKTHKNNGVYEVKGTVLWRAFPYGTSTNVLLTETLTLEVPQ